MQRGDGNIKLISDFNKVKMKWGGTLRSLAMTFLN